MKSNGFASFGSAVLERFKQKPHWQAGLHVFVLWMFAGVQPLFSLLSDRQNLHFLTAHDVVGSDIVLMTLLLLLAVPMILIGLEWLSGKISESFRKFVHGLFIFLLLLMFCLPVMKKAAMPDLLTVTAAVTVAGLLLLAYKRAPGFRNYLSVLSPVILIFGMS